MNPHPGAQASLNIPTEDGVEVPGMQHKYRETVLFFPSAGQTCHAYCTYCFRWPQFVGLDDMKFASKEVAPLVAYLKQHREVQSVLLTGGDPLVMRSAVLRRYIEPLLNDAALDHVTSIRIGSKAPAYWPHRFVQGEDAADLLRLFSEVRTAGKEMALMAHFSHPRELETEIAQMAMDRVLAAGATVRTQAPLIKHVNDSAPVWADLWARQVKAGLVPYYMFVERDTGARGYFEVPLWRASMIFSEAYQQLTGLGRTARGPVMSCTPGKVLVEGVADIHGEKVFVLKLLQGRDPSWVNRIFFARYSQRASWMSQLKPALGEEEFFFAEGMRSIRQSGEGRVWMQSDVNSLEESWRLDPHRSSE
jgi:KamA family protein